MAPKPKEHFIHVNEETGAEEVFDTAPTDRKSLKIWTMGYWEQTKTYDIVMIHDNEKGKAQPVRPKGLGWELHDTSEPFSTVWRRRRRTR